MTFYDSKNTGGRRTYDPVLAWPVLVFVGSLNSGFTSSFRHFATWQDLAGTLGQWKLQLPLLKI